MSKNPDRILLIGWNGKGGADTVVRGLRKGLETRGLETDVLYHGFNQPPVLDSSAGARSFNNVKEFLAGDLSDYLAIHTHLTTFEPDDVQTLRRKAGESAIVYTAHSVIPHDTLNSVQNARYKNWCDSLGQEQQNSAKKDIMASPFCRNQAAIIRNSDKVINMTRTGEDIYKTWFPESSDKSILIPNGSDMHILYENPDVNRKAAQLRQKFGGGNVVLYTGRLHQDKGILDLAEAFDKARDADPQLKLVYVGSSPDSSVPALVLQKIRPAFRKDVFFEGWIGDKETLASEYAASDMIVLPSYYESFGLSVLEGIMMGKPAIASDVDGMGDVFVNPMYAYGMQPGDITKLTERILQVTRNPKTARANAVRARKAVTDKYSLDTVVDATLGLYLTAVLEKYFTTIGSYKTGMPGAFEAHIKSGRIFTTPESMQNFGNLCIALGKVSGKNDYMNIGNAYLREARDVKRI